MVGIKPSLIPKKNRKAIYETLFKEGVMVVEKDPRKARHPDIDVPNLHVMLALRSLKSKNLVTEIFNWRHHYFFLNNDGIESLREYLGLPINVFPNTLQTKKGLRPEGARNEMDGTWRDRGEGGGRGRGRGRGGYGGFNEDRPRGDFGGGRGARGGDWSRPEGEGNWGAGEWGQQGAPGGGDAWAAGGGDAWTAQPPTH
eukprot:Selendium_serpulae@DN5654_c0_g1_i1.p1